MYNNGALLAIRIANNTTASLRGKGIPATPEEIARSRIILDCIAYGLLALAVLLAIGVIMSLICEHVNKNKPKTEEELRMIERERELFRKVISKGKWEEMYNENKNNRE